MLFKMCSDCRCHVKTTERFCPMCQHPFPKGLPKAAKIGIVIAGCMLAGCVGDPVGTPYPSETETATESPAVGTATATPTKSASPSETSTAS